MLYAIVMGQINKLKIVTDKPAERKQTYTVETSTQCRQTRQSMDIISGIIHQ